jgi:hypothetical protein
MDRLLEGSEAIPAISFSAREVCVWHLEAGILLGKNPSHSQIIFESCPVATVVHSAWSSGG